MIDFTIKSEQMQRFAEKNGETVEQYMQTRNYGLCKVSTRLMNTPHFIPKRQI